MTEKELHKIIVSGLDCVKAEDSVKAHIKKELTGDTMMNNDIIMNTGKGNTAERSNSRNIKVNRHGRIVAAAAAIAVLAGGGYMLSHNFSKIPEDDSRPAAAVTDVTPTSDEDLKTEEIDPAAEEHRKIINQAVELTEKMYDEEDVKLGVYTLDDTHVLVEYYPKEGNLKDYYVWDISDPDNMTYQEIKDEPSDYVQIFDGTFAIITIVPDEGAGYEYLTVLLYDYDLELVNSWKCQSEDGAHFTQADQEATDGQDHFIAFTDNKDRILTYQSADEGIFERCYDIYGNMYDESGDLIVEDLPDDGIENYMTYSMPRTGNVILLGTSDKGETIIQRKFPTADKWTSLTIASDFDAVQGFFDTAEKTYMFTGTADAKGLLYILDWENGSTSRKDVDMPSTYVTADGTSPSGRFAAMVFDMGNGSSALRVYDTDKDFDEVCSTNIEDSFTDAADVSVEIDEESGILSIYRTVDDHKRIVEVNIFTGDVNSKEMEETTEIKEYIEFPVPDVALEESEVALSELRSCTFETEITYEYSDDVLNGLVIRTEPPAGTEMSWGSKITVVVSKGVETNKGGLFSKSRQNTANGNAKTIFAALCEAEFDLENKGIPMDWNEYEPHWISLNDEVSVPEEKDTLEYKQAYIESLVHDDVSGLIGSDCEYLIKYKNISSDLDFKIYLRNIGDDTIIGCYPEPVQDQDEAKAVLEEIKDY